METVRDSFGEQKFGKWKRLLINKAKGENMPLLMGANGSPSFTVGSGATEWIISVSDKNKYGTNAYQLFGSNASKALVYDNGVVSSSPQTGNKSQTWVFQFNQMVKDYFCQCRQRQF